MQDLSYHCGSDRQESGILQQLVLLTFLLPSSALLIGSLASSCVHVIEQPSKEEEAAPQWTAVIIGNQLVLQCVLIPLLQNLGYACFALGNCCKCQENS